MESSEKKASEEIWNVECDMVARILDLPAEELLAEMRDDGIDPGEDADLVGQLLERSAGKARMAAARAALAASRSRQRGQNVVNIPQFSGAIREAKGLTMAARHGMEQTEADIESIAADLAELAALDEGAAKE